MFTIWMRLVYLLCPTKQDTSASKSLWVQDSRRPSHSCSCYKHKKKRIKLIPLLFTDLCAQDALEGGCNSCHVWWFGNQMAWMTSNVLESWMMSLNVHFKS